MVDDLHQITGRPAFGAERLARPPPDPAVASVGFRSVLAVASMLRGTVEVVPLTSGINHVAMVTDDLDRLIEFYTSVFEAEVRADLTEGPVRHALIDLGSEMALHPFEFSGRAPDGPYGEMFERGHLDHVSLNVSDEATFALLRRRLVERGASDGTMTDFGAVRTVAFRDPDDWWCEIAIWTDGDVLPLDQAIVSEMS